MILTTIITGIYSLLNLKFFRKEIKARNYKQITVLVIIINVFIIILASILLLVCRAEGVELNEAYKKDFVESLKSEKVNLELGQKALETVNEVDSPYDYNQMEKYFEEDKQNRGIMFDTAYFNGKFYLYYGILPALILFLPVNILFGEYLNISVGIFIFLAFGAIYTVKLLKEIINRYYKNIPVALIIILSAFMLFNNKILWTMSRPQVYELVISAGYCFVMAGMYTFFKYLNNRKKIQLFISCLLMALAVACRPTTLLISIIILVFLTKDLIKKIKNNEKKEARNIIITAITPYIIVGILLMTYNYIRFNNIFEFGANYQISVTDFRTFGFNIKRAFIGLTDYFLSPIKIIPEFPFVTSENWQPEYTGFYYSQSIGGGYFATSLIGIVLLLIPTIKNKIKKYSKEMYQLIIVLITIGIILAIIESNKAGSIGRYMMDFIWLFNIATSLVILFIYKNIQSEELKQIFIKILCTVVLISCGVNWLMTFSAENYLIKKFSLEVYHFIKYMICFWI